MRRFLYAVLLVVLLGLPQAVPTEACGGLFCTSTPVDQAAERIIFTVDSQAGEVTAYVQINYTGDSDSFSWVVPVPNNPKIDVADISAFDQLSQLTATQIRFPPPPDCFQMVALSGGAAPQSAAAEVLQQGSIGPYDFAVVDGGAPEMIAWLRDNGYRITPEMEPLVTDYSEAGMVFVAIKLSGGKGAQDIQPLVMTYKATQPMIPIRLTAVAATPNMGIVTWIFADQQAKPINMPRLVMREADIAMTDMFGGNNYTDLRSGVLDSVGGHGFVVEYAEPSAQLLPSDPLLQQLAARYPFVTRLYGEMSPEEMTVDPMFELNGDLPPVSNVFDLTNRIPPYDCAEQEIHTVRRQQYEATSRSPEMATKDLRRGPLRIFTTLLVVMILALIVFLARRGPRRAS